MQFIHVGLLEMVYLALEMMGFFFPERLREKKIKDEKYHSLTPVEKFASSGEIEVLLQTGGHPAGRVFTRATQLNVGFNIPGDAKTVSWSRLKASFVSRICSRRVFSLGSLLSARRRMKRVSNNNNKKKKRYRSFKARDSQGEQLESAILRSC